MLQSQFHRKTSFLTAHATKLMQLSSKLFLRLLALLGGGLLLSLSSAGAQQAQPEIDAIVLSKNCPIPDGPDLIQSAPEVVIDSVDNPYCPRLNDIQLVQVTALNPTEETRSVGVEIVITLNGNRLDQSLQRIVTIPSRDDVKILHDLVLEEGGRYRVSAKIWDTDFAQLLSESSAGINRQFFIATPRDVQEAQSQLVAKQESGAAPAPVPLEFDPPDLRWESVNVIPRNLLRGETMRMRLNLVNVGGDIVRDVQCKVEYFNLRQPRRRTIIATPIAPVMAPGETVTFDLEYIPPDDQLLGDYQIAVEVDPQGVIEEQNEENNVMESEPVRLSDIKLLLPPENFVFEENGLFLFQWDSLAYGEFKLQVGVDENFEDPRAFFDLPQGDRWIADKELVPLSGELPGMAMGLMQTSQKNKLFWRVIGRNTSGQQVISEVQSFTIKPASDAS
jgi:hypothetical protein